MMIYTSYTYFSKPPGSSWDQGLIVLEAVQAYIKQYFTVIVESDTEIEN